MTENSTQSEKDNDVRYRGMILQPHPSLASATAPGEGVARVAQSETAREVGIRRRVLQVLSQSQRPEFAGAWPENLSEARLPALTQEFPGTLGKFYQPESLR